MIQGHAGRNIDRRCNFVHLKNSSILRIQQLLNERTDALQKEKRVDEICDETNGFSKPRRLSARKKGKKARKIFICQLFAAKESPAKWLRPKNTGKLTWIYVTPRYRLPSQALSRIESNERRNNKKHFRRILVVSLTSRRKMFDIYNKIYY